MLTYRTKIIGIPLAVGVGIVIAFIIFLLELTGKPMVLLVTYDGLLLLSPIIISAIALSVGVYSKLIGDRRAVYMLVIGVGAFLTVGYFALLWLYATSPL